MFFRSDRSALRDGLPALAILSLALPAVSAPAGAQTPAQPKAGPAVAIQAVEKCDALTRWLLGAGMCAGDFYVPLPEGAAAGNAAPVVRLVGTNNIAVADGLAKATPAEGAMTLSLGTLPPGAYTGEIVYGAANARARVPLSVSVRTSALWPFLMIVAGVLLGRLVKFMKERGNAIADSRLRLDRLRARVRRLDAEGQEAAAPAVDEADMRVDSGTDEEAKTALDALERSVTQLERLARLARAAGTAHSDRIAAIRLKIKIGSLDEAEAQLKALAALLGVPAAGTALDESTQITASTSETVGGPGTGAAIAAGTASALQWAGRAAAAVRGAWRTFIAYAARPLIYLILLVALVLAGLKALYVSGNASPTLGGKPLSDLLVLFGWGLAADVASRTLSDFRGPAQRTP